MSDKESYERFVEWLGKAWWGLPESEHLMPAIKAFYTPEEAALLTSCKIQKLVKKRRF